MATQSRSNWLLLTVAFALAGCGIYVGHRYVRWRADQEAARARELLANEEPQRVRKAARLCAQYLVSHPEDAGRVGIPEVSDWAVRKGLASPDAVSARHRRRRQQTHDAAAKEGSKAARRPG